jgi:hypothetical protein
MQLAALACRRHGVFALFTSLRFRQTSQSAAGNGPKPPFEVNAAVGLLQFTFHTLMPATRCQLAAQPNGFREISREGCNRGVLKYLTWGRGSEMSGIEGSP